MTAVQSAGVPFGGALGGASSSAQRASDEARGRTRVTSKAITRVAAALGAEALGVSTRSVSVRLSDDNGMLALTVSGPIRMPALNDLLGAAGRVATGRPAGAAIPAGAASVPPGETILDRCERAQQHIRESTSALTGASISRVIVHLTGIETTQKERVQ